MMLYYRFLGKLFCVLTVLMFSCDGFNDMTATETILK